MSIEHTDLLQFVDPSWQVLGVLNADELPADFETARQQIKIFCKTHHKTVFNDHERLLFLMTSDIYDSNTAGTKLRMIQSVVNEVDISNFFVTVITTNSEFETEAQYLRTISQDPVPLQILYVQGHFDRLQGDKSRYEFYRYGSPEPLKVALQDLTEREKFLLTQSKVFCIYPWIHLHAYPTGEAFPCCHATQKNPVGNTKKSTLEEIWRGSPMQSLRQNMLDEKSSAECVRCYEQERSGFFSGRQSANKHHGHHIKKLQDNPFEMTYWDIRFSNLCNLRCRSCGHIFSSQWYQDQATLAGPEWKKNNQVLNYAGRTETDMWEQLLPHFDYVEQIYFAGGEPLLMEEHYRILDELEKRNRFDVRLIYNTNFTHTDLKGRSVFDYWKKFHSVAVGASLDAMGDRAEYIRKGTTWSIIEQNRREMLRICPEVDFYISPTLSILNAWHLPDFHRTWTDMGLIRAQDLNINILQDPAHYRIDIATKAYKSKIQQKYLEHLDWLKHQDKLQRATVGYQSAISFMMATDNTPLIEQFWRKTHQLDEIRRECITDVIPELEVIR